MRNPHDWRVRLVVASIHEALGELARAREELREVLRTDPARALAHYRIGMLYRQSTSTEQVAREHLREYLELEPDGAHSAEVRAALERPTSASVDRETRFGSTP